MKDEEYYKRINNIYSLLVKAYMDKYILESIEHFKKEKQDKQEKNSFFYNNTVFTLIHICELAKADLALELWKMYYDNKAQANTIKQLKNYLNSEYKLRLYPKMAKFIEDKIKIEKWAPDVIIGYMKTHGYFSKDGFCPITVPTIYNAIRFGIINVKLEDTRRMKLHFIINS